MRGQQQVFIMNETTVLALTKELAKGLKTESDLNDFTQVLMKKLKFETALNTELTEYLGHEKHSRKSGSNACNGYTSTLIVDLFLK